MPPFQDDDNNITIDDEHEAAVAATAFAIYSLEEGELIHLKKLREAPKSSRPQTMRRKEDIISMRSSESSRKKSSGRRVESGIIPIRSQSGVASPKPISPALAPKNQNQNGKTRADAWEISKIERIQKQYQKRKFQIVAWENEKKMEVKLKMERKKKALEQKRAVLMQYYQNKIARIDMTARGARAQLEERRRKEESKVKEKAKKIRATGSVPVKYCFCFNCY